MMRKIFLVGVLVLLGAGGQAVAAPPDCEAARCAVQAALSECPCDLGVPGGTVAATNHGRYVACVAHAIHRLSKGPNAVVPKNCKGKITRCAARSICGKPGAVTCQIPQLGMCDTTTGTCVDDPLLVCSSNADCVIGTRCKIKRSAELCEEKGGTVGTANSCCADCGP